MRRGWAALVVGLVAGVAGACGSSTSSRPVTPGSTTQTLAQPAPSPAQVARCRPSGAQVVAVSSSAVAYTVPSAVARGGLRPGATVPGVAIYGCRLDTHRRVRLDTTVNLGKVTLNGTTLAYATSQAQGIDTIAANITVADIRLGHQLFNVPAGHVAIAPKSVSVDAIAVTPAGVVAWIQHGGTVESPGYSVHVASPSKPEDRQLAAGPAIDPRSLRLSGATVSWVDGGQRRTASL